MSANLRNRRKFSSVLALIGLAAIVLLAAVSNVGTARAEDPVQAIIAFVDADGRYLPSNADQAPGDSLRVRVDMLGAPLSMQATAVLWRVKLLSGREVLSHRTFDSNLPLLFSSGRSAPQFVDLPIPVEAVGQQPFVYAAVLYDPDGPGSAAPVLIGASARIRVAAAPSATTYTLTTEADPPDGSGGYVEIVGGEHVRDERKRFNSGETAMIMARSNPGWRFVGWSGHVQGYGLLQALVMDEDKSVTARWVPIPPPTYTLTATDTPDEGGHVEITGGLKLRDGEKQFKPGETAVIKAIPNSDWTFAGWSGHATGTTASLEITMDHDNLVIAHWKRGAGDDGVEPTAQPKARSCYEQDLGTLNASNDFYLSLRRTAAWSFDGCQADLLASSFLNDAHLYRFQIEEDTRVSVYLRSYQGETKTADSVLYLYKSDGQYLAKSAEPIDGRGMSHALREVELAAGRYYAVAMAPDGKSGAYSFEIFGLNRCNISQIPAPNRSQGLVLLTHGWTLDDPSVSPWIDETAEAMRDTVRSSWQVMAYHWEADAATGPNLARARSLLRVAVRPARLVRVLRETWEAAVMARQNGVRHGQCLARALYGRGYNQLHLIGHSAGAILVDALGDEIERMDSSIETQLTFLDAFTLSWNGTLGDNVDYAEHYVNTDDVADFGAINATDIYSEDSVHTIDITELGNGLDGTGWGHSWPRRYYACSVMALSGDWDESSGAAECESEWSLTWEKDPREWMLANPDHPGWARSIATRGRVDELMSLYPAGTIEKPAPQ